MVTFFSQNSEFEGEFQRCCKEYRQLEIYVAWVGNPNYVIPFEHLHNVTKINAVVGVSFYQTHPDGLQYLLDLGVNLRIARFIKGRKEILFHPKIYIFSNNNKKAVFIGSSNFTGNGFNGNCEANVLIEGASTSRVVYDFENDLKKWRAEEFSFVPDKKWLEKYAESYKKRRKKLQDAGLDDEVESEDKNVNFTAWLAIADWDLYVKKVKMGLGLKSATYQKALKNKIELFNLYERELSVPWKIEYFKEIEKRRLIGGIRPYGWLGHVAASGDFRRMLANGSSYEYKTIISTVNNLAELSIPLNWKRLSGILTRLVDLGPSMKVWGRLLAIIRPDLFCTISAPVVRKNIAETLDKSEKFLEEVEGYIMLLKLIHSSPWFNSKAPNKNQELEIWRRRVAFLDVIFYE